MINSISLSIISVVFKPILYIVAMFSNELSLFLQEKAAWEQLNGVSVEELKRLSLESLDGAKKKKSGGLSGVSFRMGR